MSPARSVDLEPDQLTIHNAPKKGLCIYDKSMVNHQLSNFVVKFISELKDPKLDLLGYLWAIQVHHDLVFQGLYLFSGLPERWGLLCLYLGHQSPQAIHGRASYSNATWRGSRKSLAKPGQIQQVSQDKSLWSTWICLLSRLVMIIYFLQSQHELSLSLRISMLNFNMSFKLPCHDHIFLAITTRTFSFTKNLYAQL